MEQNFMQIQLYRKRIWDSVCLYSTLIERQCPSSSFRQYGAPCVFGQALELVLNDKKQSIKVQ